MPSDTPAPHDEKSRRRQLLQRWIVVVCLICLLGVVGIGMAAWRTLQPQRGGLAGSGPRSLGEAARDWRQIAANPRAGFPGKTRLNILCLGVDADGRAGAVTPSFGGRSDAIFMLSLDLVHRTIGVLSVPRDTYALISGTRDHAKINGAYQRGGALCASDTVAAFLGVHPDHYVVISTAGVRTLVDALGGVDVTVEHPMYFYPGIDLKPGRQRLDGEHALAFIRFRHSYLAPRTWLQNLLAHGAPEPAYPITPESGDHRRMYRQEILLRAMAERARTLPNILRADSLIDTAMSCMRTDMTRAQLFDLVALFPKTRFSEITAAQLPTTNFRAPDGGADLLVDEQVKRLYVDWLLRGNARAGRALVNVTIADAGGGAHVRTQQAIQKLREAGYTHLVLGDAPDVGKASILIIDSGEPCSAHDRDIASILGIMPAVTHQAVSSNGYDWPPPLDVRVVLRDDAVQKEHH